jgi:phosphoribosylformylglycinamidine synthase
MFGPVAAVYIIIVKILLKMVMMGSSSIGTGEVQNVLLSCSYVLPAVLLYMTKKTKKRAAIGLVLGTVAAIITAIITNLYLIIPFYAKLAGMTTQDIIDSVNELEEAIYNSQIMMLPGGFSAGDEPEGSGKFIATFLRNPKLKAAISDLLDNRDGLMIGICNGFQALIKLGLLPYGKIKDMTDTDPTLTFNTIARHVSQMVQTKIVSVKSPWLANVNVGDLHTIAVSHGEGRFVAPKEVIDNLFASGQVFSLYTDNLGNPTMQSPYNPNGSMMGIEGIVSCDGRILGKMGHSERQGVNRNKNIYGEMDQQLFEAGVNYFKKK